MKFRKKPVVIEALQYIGTNEAAVAEWVGDAANTQYGYLIISTLEGAMSVSHGDWVIRGVQGEFYPCKPDIFEATYEPVEETS